MKNTYGETTPTTTMATQIAAVNNERERKRMREKITEKAKINGIYCFPTRVVKS